MNEDNNLIPFKIATSSNEAKIGEPVDIYSKTLDNNGNGGEPPMDNKYVTHKELELSNEKLLHHIDNRFNEMDKHFNKLELEINDVKNTTNANINDVKNTADTNKEKINWILYSVIGGIVISVFTTLITNLFK